MTSSWGWRKEKSGSREPRLPHRNSHRQNLGPNHPAWMRGPLMDFSSHGNAEAGATAGVRAALRQCLREARRFGWQVLLVGSGFWLEAAACTERFVVDVADILEQRRGQPDHALARHWSSRVVNGVLGGLVRAVRRCGPAARAGQRLAARTDMILLECYNRSRHSDTAVQTPTE